MTMPLGVLDVGSNTTRLLVARVERGEIVVVDKEKVRLPLGEEIERFGLVSDLHVVAAAKAVRKLANRARLHSVESLDVFLTAPGRQSANAAELVGALTSAAGVPHARPDWLESVDLGSVRLTTRVGSIAEAQAEAADAFAHVEPPRVDAALAVGGSARAARRLVGSHLGPDELAEALHLVEKESERSIVRRFGVDRARARILPAGIVLLAEVQQRLGVPLHVCNGGIREGAVLEFAAARAA
jgi:exopolyphosphatase/guanosine-5'-triphosphate,3'-diphosphate pyrophosphatase